MLIAGEITAAEEILIPAIRRCVEHQSLPSFHRGLPIVKARFQNQPTIGGFALVKRSLLEGICCRSSWSKSKAYPSDIKRQPVAAVFYQVCFRRFTPPGTV